jgi:hypothetical protein
VLLEYSLLVAGDPPKDLRRLFDLPHNQSELFIVLSNHDSSRLLGSGQSELLNQMFPSD